MSVKKTSENEELNKENNEENVGAILETIRGVMNSKDIDFSEIPVNGNNKNKLLDPEKKDNSIDNDWEDIDKILDLVDKVEDDGSITTISPYKEEYNNKNDLDLVINNNNDNIKHSEFDSDDDIEKLKENLLNSTEPKPLEGLEIEIEMGCLEEEVKGTITDLLKETDLNDYEKESNNNQKTPDHPLSDIKQESFEKKQDGYLEEVPEINEVNIDQDITKDLTVNNGVQEIQNDNKDNNIKPDIEDKNEFKIDKENTLEKVMNSTETQNKFLKETKEEINKESLLSEETMKETTETFRKLLDQTSKQRDKNITLKKGIAIEDLVIEALKPPLAEWLDKHLPNLVKSLVEKEIKRLIPEDDNFDK